MKIKKFEATWCKACKDVNPILEGYNVEKIDVDDYPELVSEYQIKKLPTLVFEKDGTEVDRYVGVISKEDLEEKYNG